MASLTIQMGNVPPAPPTPGYTASAPVIVSANNQVIEYLVIDSMPNQAMTLAAGQISPNTGGPTGAQTSSIYLNGFSGVTIRHCLMRGRQWGLLAINCPGLTLLDVQAMDMNYCGFGIFGGNNGSMTDVSAQRIGMLRDTSGFPSIGDPGNSYGIKFEKASAAGGGAVGETPPTTWLIDGFLVEDVPYWQGVNAHQVSDLTIQNGIVRRCPRGFFWAGTVSKIRMLNNQLLAPVTRQGGTSDKSAISYGSLQGPSLIDGNSIDHLFTNALNNIDAFVGGVPTSGLTIGTNPIV